MTRQPSLFETHDTHREGAPQSRVRILAWNLQSPNHSRAVEQVRWIERQDADALVLTELTYGTSSLELVRRLEETGYLTFFCKSRGGRYTTALCVRDQAALKMDAVESFPSSRLQGCRLDLGRFILSLWGVYAPTGWYHTPADKLEYRRNFQLDLLRLVNETAGHGVVCGDLNVLEPGASVLVPGLEDAGLYRGLMDSGYVDAYRFMNPDGCDVSWVSPDGCGLRLDYCLVSNLLIPFVTECRFDHDPRYNELSDHSALWFTIDTQGA